MQKNESVNESGARRVFLDNHQTHSYIFFQPNIGFSNKTNSQKAHADTYNRPHRMILDSDIYFVCLTCEMVFNKLGRLVTNKFKTKFILGEAKCSYCHIAKVGW